MNFEVIDLRVRKYTYKYNGEEYYVFVTNGEDNFTEFYICKQHYQDVFFQIGLNMQQMNCSIEEYIEEEINEWIESYEENIVKLEQE